MQWQLQDQVLWQEASFDPYFIEFNKMKMQSLSISD